MPAVDTNKGFCVILRFTEARFRVVLQTYDYINYNRFTKFSHHTGLDDYFIRSKPFLLYANE